MTEVPIMVKPKKCYNCLSEVEGNADHCPRCDLKLGARLESGIAAKPGTPFVKILLVLGVLAIAGKMAGYSYSGDTAQDALSSAPVKLTTIGSAVKDGAIQKIKEKGAKDLRAVGVNDVGYNDDTLCVYVDQRFSSLSKPQQQQLLSIVASEWEKAIGKESTAVKIMEYGTDKTIAEMVIGA